MILLFYGPNQYAARQKIRELITRFKKTDPSGFGLERHDASAIKPEDHSKLLSSLTSLPFLGSNRLIVIEDLLLNPKLADAVMDVLDQVPDSTVAIIYERKVDGRSKQFKVLKSLVKNLEFTDLNPLQLQKWIIKGAQDLGGQIDAATATFLVDRAGHDQWRLHNEINKLVNFSPQITKETIEQLVEPKFEQSIFDLVEALTYGRVADALKLYTGLRSTKIQPLYILSMIGWQLRNLLIAQSAILSGGKTPNEIVTDHGLSPYVVGKSLKAAGRLKLPALKTSHRLLVETDQALKTTSLDADIAVEQLLIGIGRQLQTTS